MRAAWARQGRRVRLGGQSPVVTGRVPVHPRGMSLDRLLTSLQPLLARLGSLDPSQPGLAAQLNRELPLGSEPIASLRKLVREGVEARWLCERENSGVRFSRVLKGAPGALSIDAVHMAGPGAAHTHPNGEIDLCFAVSGDARFDGQPEGWVVYGPNTWHVPTVSGGVMDIPYFLPGGAIRFGERPPDAKPVGLQAT